VSLALRYAAALGSPCLHAMAGILPAGADRARHRAMSWTTCAAPPPSWKKPGARC
jgi:hydroxypyruvate isomerase